MSKKILSIVAVFFLSGCLNFDLIGGPSQGSTTGGGITKSTDGGRTFVPHNTLGEKETIDSVSVVSIVSDPIDSERIYIGTRRSGIFVSHDGGAMWGHLEFPPLNVSNIAINTENTNVLYATGIWQGRAKLYRSDDAGLNWREVYVEPQDGTALTALAIDPIAPQKVFIGTSDGVFLQSWDGGQTWRTLYNAGHSIEKITFDAADTNTVYMRVGELMVLKSRDGGQNFEDISERAEEAFGSFSLYSLAVDPSHTGIVYIGTNKGIYHSADYGDAWQEVNVIGSTNGIPIHAIAINPNNSDQVTYAAAQAVYTSVATGTTQWSIAESSPDKIVDVILYDPFDPKNIYLGLRGTR